MPNATWTCGVSHPCSTAYLGVLEEERHADQDQTDAQATDPELRASVQEFGDQPSARWVRLRAGTVVPG
jgi:hypothetical protein